MIFKNPLKYFNQFSNNFLHQFRKIYLKSNFYDKKISKIYNDKLEYKPSPHLLSSLIKYQSKKFKIDDLSSEMLWNQKNISEKEFKRLNNFFWFFSLDLKSSKKTTQTIVHNWIKNNYKYNSKSWEFDITAKRIIALLSNYHLTFENSDKEYQDNFNGIIQKQTNHLIQEITKSKSIEDKIIGCASIILAGLCYQNEKNYLSYGLSALKKVVDNSIDNQGFPKSRSIKQLIFYLKYFILIREWIKESQSPIPEFIDETIYYLGQGYAFMWQNIETDLLFNGNNISNNLEFDQYLKRLGYKFSNQSNDFSGYTILKNKKISLIMDIGPSPGKDFSKEYQSGALSFEIVSNNKKLISNCGYYNGNNIKLNELSRSTATHSALLIEDYSSCKFSKNTRSKFEVEKGLKILKKNIVHEKNYWKINAAHDGYLKQFNSIHEREIEFYPEQFKFVGNDKIINKNSNKKLKFDIRFHLEPNTKVMKTQDKKAILIDLEDEGWKFTCDNFDINIDNGLYFGNKNSYTENQNIFITGFAASEIENIKWELTKLR